MLAPRVCLYDPSAPPPRVTGGVLALAQLPSAAFGDGTHPTTQLCAAAVYSLVRPGVSVLDVGTGSGVLARIARARGASFIVGTDIDEGALRAAAANVALDRHAVPIALTSAAPDAFGPRFDLVVANILHGPLLSLAPALIAALAPGGTLLLSGFGPLEAPMLRVAFSPLAFRSQSMRGEWALLAFGRACAEAAQRE